MGSKKVRAYIGIGSDLGDRAGNLLLAVRGLIEAGCMVTRLSSIYETEPVGLESPVNFLNMAVEVEAKGISPTQMMARMLRIEYLLGRTDKSLKKSRTIDLDLLFYNNVQIETDFLTLPHPRLHLRNFVLVPMAEIAPTYVHPILHKDIKTLLAESTDEAAVHRWYPLAESAAQTAAE